MKKKYLLGFDVGTYESKATLTDIEGYVVGTASVSHKVSSLQPGFAEHDPLKDWMYDLRKVVKELMKQVQGKTEEIAAIGISTIMAAVTFVDDNCDPLRNAILYGIDSRCTRQAEELNKKIGKERLHRVYGTEMTIEHFGPKILWVKENEPEIFTKTKHITFASGFLTARLTGKYFVDYYSASCALPMLNPTTMKWDENGCELICPKEMLPQITGTYSVVGTVTARGEKESGLAKGTPVICGTTDAGAEAVSAGVVEPGDIMLMYGSTSFWIALLREEQGENTGLPYTIENRKCLIGGMATTGSLIRWLRDKLSPDLFQEEMNGGDNAFSAMEKEAECISAGSDGLIVLPYFQGERCPIQDPKARGLLFGLNLQHTRGHIIHASYEGIAYGISQNLELLKQKGVDVDYVVSVGGGIRSRTWLQVVSDVCGITQIVPEVTIGASYGDALMAGIAIGMIKSPQKIKELVKIKKIVRPNREHYIKYKKYKAIFDELYIRNKDLMHRIDE